VLEITRNKSKLFDISIVPIKITFVRGPQKYLKTALLETKHETLQDFLLRLRRPVSVGAEYRDRLGQVCAMLPDHRRHAPARSVAVAFGLMRRHIPNGWLWIFGSSSRPPVIFLRFQPDASPVRA
jgi:hypothetical protein